MRSTSIPLVVLIAVATACSVGDANETRSTPAGNDTTSTEAQVTEASTNAALETETTEPDSPDSPDLPTSNYLSNYNLIDSEFGTDVSVTVLDGVRQITANALPNHETGSFPNANNPNTISAQNRQWSFPTEPTWTGSATWAMVPGVSINGVKFEPETAESTDCATGETYRIEALQNTYNLGFDTNNAHVQPNGEYHYHGVSELMVEAFNGTTEDLVHVGFAADGYLVYYSKSGAYRPGYALSADPRTGTTCQPSLRNQTASDLERTMPDGTYVSDWVWSADSGDLDVCNGTTIGDTYVYLLTTEYPFISRCLNGEFTNQQGPPPPG